MTGLAPVNTSTLTGGRRHRGGRPGYTAFTSPRSDQMSGIFVRIHPRRFQRPLAANKAKIPTIVGAPGSRAPDSRALEQR